MGLFNEGVSPQGYKLGGEPENTNPFFEGGPGGGGLSPENINITGQAEYDSTATEPSMTVNKTTTEDSASFNIDLKIPEAKAEVNRNHSGDYSPEWLCWRLLNGMANTDMYDGNELIATFNLVTKTPEYDFTQNIHDLLEDLRANLSYSITGRTLLNNSILSTSTTYDFTDEYLSEKFKSVYFKAPQGMGNGFICLNPVNPLDPILYNVNYVIHINGCRRYPDIVSNPEGNIDFMEFHFKGSYDAVEDLLAFSKLTITCVDNGTIAGFQTLASGTSDVAIGSANFSITTTRKDTSFVPMEWGARVTTYADKAEQILNMFIDTDYPAAIYYTDGNESGGV